MPSAEGSLADPISLLPTVLEQLPSLHRKPSLATDVLSALRKACPSQQPQAFLIPLLPHLTAFALTAPPSLLPHAAHTVVTLTRTLVARRQITKTKAYLQELVTLTIALLQRRESRPLPFKLPSFEAANLPILPLTVSTLSAALLLLALHIPSTIEPPLPSIPNPISNLPTQLSEQTALAIRLWLSVGSRARSSIFHLASRPELLTGRCGHIPAALSAHILLRAFDPSAAIAPPPCFRERLVPILSSAIEQAPDPAALFKLLALASPTGSIPPDLVAVHAVPRLLRSGPVSDVLRSYSRGGMLDFHTLPTPHALRSEDEPPSKRRRVEISSSSASQRAEGESASGMENVQSILTESPSLSTPSCLTPANEDPDRVVFTSSPAAALQQRLLSLHSIRRIATTPDTAHLLARAVNVAADALHSIRRRSDSCEGTADAPDNTLKDWLYLASPLTAILCDALKELASPVEIHMLSALHDLIIAGVQLLKSLKHTASTTIMTSTLDEEVDEQANVDTPKLTIMLRDAILLGFQKFYAQDDLPSDPVALSSMCAAITAVANTALDHPELFVFDTANPFDLSEVSVLRSSMSGSNPLSIQQAVFGLARALPKALPLPEHDDLISRATGPTELDAEASRALLLAMADAVCATVSCQTRHDRISYNVHMQGCTSQNVWCAASKLALNAIVADDSSLVCAAISCISVLLAHAPTRDVDLPSVQTAIISCLWRKSACVRDFAATHISGLLRVSRGVRSGSQRWQLSCHCGIEEWAEAASMDEDLPVNEECPEFEHCVIRGILNHVTLAKDILVSPNYAVGGTDQLHFDSLLRCVPFEFDDRFVSRVAGLVCDVVLAAAISEIKEAEAADSCDAPVDDVAHTLSGTSQSAFSSKVWRSILKTIIPTSRNVSLVNYMNPSAQDGTVASVILQGNISSSRCISPVGTPISTFFGSRLKEWLPLSMKRMFEDERFTAIMKDLLHERDSGALWAKVHRYAAPSRLLCGDVESIQVLASKMGVAENVIVQRIVPEVLAWSVITDEAITADTALGALISRFLKKPIEVIVKEKAGKLVQRLVNEFGGPFEQKAKRALMHIAKILKSSTNNAASPDLFAGSLVITHFMLVMDAVGRRLFQSRASEKERLRSLRMLNVVISLCGERVHTFAPKILATLKMASDIFAQNERVLKETVVVWTSFMKTLGIEKITSHLGSILSILIPFFGKFDSLLEQVLTDVVEKTAGRQYPNRSVVILLLRLVGSASLERLARLLESYCEPGSRGGDVSSSSVSLDLSMSVENIVKLCSSVRSVIIQHGNGKVEIMATQYLYRVLRRNREVLDAKAANIVDQHVRSSGHEDGAIAIIAGVLLDCLHRTSCEECQEIIMQCIGEVGAVDASTVARFKKQVSLEYRRPDRDKRMPLHVHGLVAMLLDEYLVPTLTQGSVQSSSNNSQNRVGLVIQELLRVCGCTRSTPKRASNTVRRGSTQEELDWDDILVGATDEENAMYFWENLLVTTQEVVHPFLAQPFDVSHYETVFGGENVGNVALACEPVWAKVKALSKPTEAATAQQWRRQIIVQLVDFIGERGSFGIVLRALRPILRYEDKVTALIFPLVFTTVLDIPQEGETNLLQTFLISEISEVLRDSASPQPIFDLFDTLRSWREERCAVKANFLVDKKLGISDAGPSSSLSLKKRSLLPTYLERAKNSEPLSKFIDLEGRAAPGLSLLEQAKCAYRARSFTRAVFLAECHIRSIRISSGNASWSSHMNTILGVTRTDDPEKCLEAEACSILQKSFAELEDADSMAGITTLRSSSSLAEKIIDTEVSGRLSEALATYERAIAVDPGSVQFHNGFLRCLMTLGHWETMLAHSEGLASRATIGESALRQTAQANGIEAAWRLGRWDAIEKLHVLSFEDHEQSSKRLQIVNSWSSSNALALGKMLLSIHEKKSQCVAMHAKMARQKLRAPLMRAAREGYTRSYPMIVLLHTLADVEDSILSTPEPEQEVIDVDSGVQLRGDIQLKRLISLRSRTAVTAPSLRVREAILSTKRVCLQELGKHAKAAKVCLELARLAKDGDTLRFAAASAFRAVSMQCTNEAIQHSSALETAKIQRAQGDSAGALIAVKREIDRMRSLLNKTKRSQSSRQLRDEISDRLCTALVLAGSWVEESRSEPSEVVLKFFQDAAAYGRRRVEPHYALGRHFDSLLQAGAAAETQAAADGVNDDSGRSSRRHGGVDPLHHSRYVPLVIRSFSNALSNGHAHIFEALPRMLTVWFDYYGELDGSRPGSRSENVEEQVQKEVSAAIGRVPMYMWVTVIPQLMSRIIQRRKVVREEVMKLLAQVVAYFPDTCSWTVLPSNQLKNRDRSQAVRYVLSQAINLRKNEKRRDVLESCRDLRNRVTLANNVVKHFVNICDNVLTGDRRSRTVSCAQEFKPLKTLLTTEQTPNPIIPTMKSLTVRLPTDGERHRPFEDDPVRIVGIDDKVLVMGSLMCPRRISLVGSDGRRYRYLAKKEDKGDMRKDSRFVEFLSVVNRLLSKGSACSGKGLGLKTYAVLPLTEQTGMIEWVNDLEPFRMIVQNEHTRYEGIPNQTYIRTKYESMADKKKWLNLMFDKFPPVFDQFLVKKFGGGDAQAWLEARNEWTKSTAVWSISGYIVGLGDRHGENVLVETTTGRCVHVDFAMLFEQGRALRIPEVVPYRLTRNIVCGMGVAGYEGVFRCVCETVMTIMRRNSDVLLSMLESFLYDPLTEWKSAGAETHGAKAGVMASKEAWKARALLKAKLTGMVDKSGIALSVQGQVERTIREATSVDFLSSMYVWWGAYL